ncbi:MAG TPA: YpdA family putative bacillithiol disulfide reductase [Trueperaceae bacterium]|nr:YpdA family putative bacillithiol disulfide reductase [Trueperaceae bacterium]
MVDLAIVGAGPIGIETAILAKRAGLDYRLIEKGCIVNAVAGYPTYMTFFTTSERLEVGGHPLVTATDKPTRKEALDYYRKVVANERLALSSFTEVTAVEPRDGAFTVRTRGVAPGHRDVGEVRARAVALATGYFDNPKPLGVAGEALPNVSHYYTEAHPFFGRNVTIVGAGSSAADAALDLFRSGARVTMVHRGSDFRHSLKYWVRPNLENRVKEGSIVAHFETVVHEVLPDRVVAERHGERFDIPTNQTFLLTGYFASPALLRLAGASLDPETLAAELDPETFESDVPGLFVVGSAGFGTRTSDVFIENGIQHARKAMAAIRERLRRVPSLA